MTNFLRLIFIVIFSTLIVCSVSAEEVGTEGVNEKKITPNKTEPIKKVKISPSAKDLDRLPIPVRNPEPSASTLSYSSMKPLILPFSLKMEFTSMRGDTTVNLFDNSNSLLAKGVGKIDQYMVTLSGANMITSLLIYPNIGFFYSEVHTKDFAVDTSVQNRVIDGFIQGITKDEDKNIIDISSLSYDAKFYSTFIGIKSSYNFVYGDRDIQFIFHPHAFLNIIEWRHSKFKSGVDVFENEGEIYFAGSYGLGASMGLFFPNIRTGLKVGTDRSYFRKFKIPSEITYKKVINETLTLDNGEQINMLRPKELNVKSSEIISKFTYLSIFFIF